jgi:hypothetical protein
MQGNLNAAQRTLTSRDDRTNGSMGSKDRVDSAHLIVAARKPAVAPPTTSATTA